MIERIEKQMNTKKLQAAIEAILFHNGESVELSKIAAAIEQMNLRPVESFLI